MRKPILTVLLLIFCFEVFAQQVKITWGKENKRQYLHQSFLPFANGTVARYSLNTEGPAQDTRVKLTKTPANMAIPVFQWYGNQMEEQVNKALKSNAADRLFEKLVNLGGNFYLLTKRYDDESKRITYFSEAVDLNTFEVKGKPNILASFDIPSRSSFNIGFGFSTDSSKMYFFATDPDSKKGNETYVMAVYDQTMKKLWQRSVQLPYPAKDITLMGSLLTNEGKLLVMVNQWERDEAASTKRKEVRNPGIKMLMYEDANTKPFEFVIKLGEKGTNSLQVVEDKDGNLDLFGLYTNGYWGVVKGYYFTTLNAKAKNISEVRMFPFSDDLLKLIKTDKQNNEYYKEPCLAGEFILQQVVNREDGSRDYIIEYSRITESLNTADHLNKGLNYNYYLTEYNFGDIVDISVKTDGRHVVTRIPKNQLALMGRYGSFQVVPYKDKLVFFYNDHEDNPTRSIEKRPEDLWRNLKKGILAMAIIDAAGNVTRSVIAERSSMAGLATCIRVSRVLDNRRIALYALTDDRMFTTNYTEKVGLLEIK